MGEAYGATIALDAAFHMSTYARKPVMFVRGEGMRLYDDDGREYLDFVAGIGSVNLGHAHPAVAGAVCAQMSELVMVSNLYHTQHRGELAETLVALFGGNAKVFFANSGAEANEGAIKLARKWAQSNKGPEARTIVTAWRSFHGRTLATLAATGQASKQDAFKPLPPGFVHVELNDIEALAAAVDETVCAVMLEPVQGEGGVFPCDPDYLLAVRELCDERGVLLIFDEVQSGIYRTGTAFAHQGYGVKPDIMTLAKSLANGLPIGALIGAGNLADVFVPGEHGSTFGGGPVVCAAARATLAAHAEEHTGASAQRVGEHLRAGLRELADRTGAITGVRGRGLMNAFDVREPVAAELVAAALEGGLVLNNIGTNTIRLLPPLVCTSAEIDTLLSHLHAMLTRGEGS